MTDVELSIVAPAYNEQENIGVFVEDAAKTIGLLNKACEIVVVDDGSRDRTGEILAGLSRRYSQLKVVTHEKNMGYRASMVDGIQFSRGSLIATLDSDLQYDVSELPRFLEKIACGFDAVVGVRSVKEDTLLRRVLSRGLTLYVNILFSADFPDTNCVFRLFKRQAMEHVDLAFDGFLLPTEQLIAWRLRDLKLGYVSVVQHERRRGASSFNAVTQVVKAFFFLLRLKIKSL